MKWRKFKSVGELPQHRAFLTIDMGDSDPEVTIQVVRIAHKLSTIVANHGGTDWFKHTHWRQMVKLPKEE